MATIDTQMTIAAPIARVYRVSQDYAVRYDWDPFPENIAVVSGDANDLTVGTQVRIKSKLGLSMLVEFVQVQPPSRAAVTMIQGPWFLDKFAGAWNFKELTANTTAARFTYTIKAKPALLRFVIEPIARRYFARVVAQRLAGLKAYCEHQV
jgi:uncharacterized protein YndB with AHSA1/START domain